MRWLVDLPRRMKLKEADQTASFKSLTSTNNIQVLQECIPEVLPMSGNGEESTVTDWQSE